MFNIRVYFAHGVSERFDVTRDIAERFERWLKGEHSDIFTLKDEYDTIYLNRDYVCMAKIREVHTET